MINILIALLSIPVLAWFKTNPINTVNAGGKRIAFYLLLSTAVFVAWHPLNAITINPAAAPIFLNPYFLLITTLLSITCAVSYIFSQSLWVPVIIHWSTVVIWVIFLGGRNKILEL